MFYYYNNNPTTSNVDKENKEKPVSSLYHDSTNIVTDSNFKILS